MIGIDIEKVERFRMLSEEFINSTFSQHEVSYAYKHTKPEMHLCGIFCAKEAVKKTLTDNVPMRSIVISHDDQGKPVVEKSQNPWLQEKIMISISHCDDYAVASALRLEHG